MPRRPGIGVGHRENDRDLGGGARGDELLGAVEHPAVAVAPGARLDRGGVGAGLRLGQAEGGDFALRHRPEKPPFLLLAAVLQHGAAAQRVDREDRRGGAVAGRDLLHRERIADMVGAGAAIFRRHQHAHEPELPQFGQRLLREARRTVPFGGMRRELLLRELPRRIAQQDLLFRELHRVTSPRSAHNPRWSAAKSVCCICSKSAAKFRVHVSSADFPAACRPDAPSSPLRHPNTRNHRSAARTHSGPPASGRHAGGTPAVLICSANDSPSSDSGY